MKTLTIKYRLLFLVTALLGLGVSVSCDKNEDSGGKVPGTDTQLYTPKDMSSKVMGTTIQFVWRAQPQAVSFNLELSTDASFNNPILIQTTASSYTVEALATNTKYYARVQAIAQNPAMNSPYCEALSITTGDENIMRAAPIAITDRDLTVAWTPGAEVTHVVIVSVAPGATAQSYTLNAAEKTIGEKEFTGLVYETTYNVKLYNGANLRGEGEYTTLIREMDPLAVTLAKAKPDSLLLSWAAGEEVTFFYVSPAPVSGGATITLTETEIAEGKLGAGNLLPATEYAFVAYWNQSNRDTSRFTTAAVPQSTVSSANVLLTTADISWTANAYANKLSVKPASGSAATYAVTPAASSLTLSGLVPGTAYEVDLQYAIGAATYSCGSTTFTMATGAPAATLTAGSATQTAVEISWTPSHSSYTVMHIAPATGTAKTYTVDGTTGAGTFTGLTAGTTYTASLQYLVGTTPVTAGSTTFATQPAEGPTNKDWNMSLTPFVELNATTVTATTTLNGLTITPGSVTIAVDANNKSMDGKSFTNRLKINGTGALDRGVLSFPVSTGATITVYGMSSSSTATRTLNVSDGTNIVGTLVNDGTALGKSVVTYSGPAGTIYLYPNGGFNIYDIILEYGSTPPPPSNIDWNFSDASFVAGTYSSSQTYTGGLGFIATTAKPLVVDASAQSIDGFSFTQRVKTNGASSMSGFVPTDRALSVPVSGNASIVIYATAGGTSREMKLSDGTSEIYATVGMAASLTKYTIPYTGAAGTVYIYGTNNIYIYYVGVVYN